MSIKTSLLKALGFSVADYDDDDDEMSEFPSALPVNQQPSRAKSPDATSDDASPATDVAIDTDQSPVGKSHVRQFEFPLEVFDAIIDLFNQTQPEFIKACLDKDEQRRFIYNSIDSSFKARLTEYQTQVLVASDRHNEHTIRKFENEITNLRQQLDNANKNIAEAKESNMSAMRQRRAFNERIRDLEQQLEVEKADKEQYMLETKSLLNKIKVAQVQGASDTESAETITALRTEIDKLQTKLLEAEADKQQLSRDLSDKQTALDTALAEAQQLRNQPVEPPIVVKFDTPTETDNNAAPENDTPTEPKPARRPRKPRRTAKNPTPSISVIDDSLDTTEWLIPTPPEGINCNITGVSDSEFGYHEPQREGPLNNDAQLSLFD